MWTVIFRPVFEKWFYEQSEDLQEKLLETIGLLRLNGPTLGRPYVDTIKGSSLPNLKELRTQFRGRPIRTFYAFDPERQAVLLCGGDKTGDGRFYSTMIRLSEEEFARYMAEVKEK